PSGAEILRRIQTSPVGWTPQAAANIQEPITKAAIRRRAQPPSRRPRLRRVRPTMVASSPVYVGRRTSSGQHSRIHLQGCNRTTGSTAVPSPSAAPSATYNGGIVTCVGWTPHKQRPTFKNPSPRPQSDDGLNRRPVALGLAKCHLQCWHRHLCRLDAAQAAANIQEPISKAAIRRRAQPPSRRPRLRQVRPTVVASLPV